MKILLTNPNPIILAYKEGFTSVQAVVASTTKIKNTNKKTKKNKYETRVFLISIFSLGKGVGQGWKIGHSKM